MTGSSYTCVRNFFACLFGLASSVFAQGSIAQTDLTQSFILRPVVLSFGGAYRALATSNAAIQVNPAGLALRETKAGLGVDYAFNGRTESSMWGVNAFDTTTLPGSAFGIAYDRDMPTISGVKATVQQVSMAYGQKLPQNIYVGTTVKGYLSNFTSTGNGSPDGFDVDMGLLVKSIPYLGLAVVVQNIGKGSTFEEFPLTVSGGVSLELIPYGRFAVDVVKNLNTPSSNSINTYMGAEIRFTEGIYGRGGFGIDKISDNNFYSIGGALEGPKMSLNFVFSQRLNPSDSTFAGNVEFFL